MAALRTLIRVVKFIVHVMPDLDEIVALYLLIRYGKGRYSGLTSATIEYDTNGGVLPAGETAESRLELYGELAVGTRGGQYDEHPHGRTPKEQPASATLLVAQDLGLTEIPELEALIEYAHKADAHGEQGNPMEIPFNLKTMVDTQNEEGYPTDETVAMVFRFLDGLISKQQKFFQALLKELQTAPVHNFTHRGERKTLIVVCGDNRHAARAARMAGHSAVVMQQSDGHTQIMIKREKGLSLWDTAGVLRLEEAFGHGVDLLSLYEGHVPIKSTDQLPEVPEWYYYRQSETLLNGSDKAPDKPATSIPLERIVQLVLRCLDETAWPSDRADECSAGNCTHSAQSRCVWYEMGLRRCAQMRKARRTDSES